MSNKNLKTKMNFFLIISVTKRSQNFDGIMIPLHIFDGLIIRHKFVTESQFRHNFVTDL